jgi:hypothetical protein
MSNPIDSFLDKKRAESPYISLEDGDSVKIMKVKDIKLVTKVGFSGEEKDVLRLKCEVETTEGIRDKDFDNGSNSFAKELQDKGVVVGSSFVLTRTGEQVKTRYTISEVSNPGATPAPAPEVVPSAPVEG